MSDNPSSARREASTLEYRARNSGSPFHPAWIIAIVALAALPFIGWYSKRTLEAFHPLDVPPWNDLLGNVCASCLAIGVIAAPITIILAVIGLVRFRGRYLLQTISLIALLAEIWVLACFFYLRFFHRTT